MSQLNLPEPITAYFDADQRDGEAVARCFTERAIVEDEGRSHSGHAAIKAWKAAASRKYSYTCEPLAHEQKEGRTIVKTRLTGDFPGSPVDLQFVFRLERGKIDHLEITP
ncbi:MAG TPA: nuclear transport factor 2 family protein [Albitalea sp.]|uniref:nuclear transport factor 2 family protein n=1 Tax=Piscinibacter sp. TaxID=1903157 RepID=UPI002ED5745D